MENAIRREVHPSFHQRHNEKISESNAVYVRWASVVSILGWLFNDGQEHLLIVEPRLLERVVLVELPCTGDMHTCLIHTVTLQ